MTRPAVPAAVVVALLAVLAASPASSAAGEGYKWVVMVYMDGDNNLEGAAITDFNEMERAGSTADVAIVVLLDRAPGYDSSNGDWTGARIYLVQHDTDPVNIRSQLLEDLGEVNMGDPQTLIDFVSYVASNFPAENYALIIWDHGNAWRSAGTGAPARGVAWDETDGDYLTEAELIEALSVIKGRIGALDLIGFDACLMGMVEIAYDIASGGYASVMVASQDYEPYTGWYYTPFLQRLASDPNMTAAELAAAIVEAYAYYYTNIVPTGYATLSAVDLEAASAAVASLRYAAYTMALAISANASLAEQVAEARAGVEATGSGFFPDLIRLLEALRDGVEWGVAYDPRGALDDAIFAFNRSIIAAWSAAGHAGLTGLSIYMPPSVDDYLRERHIYIRQTLFALESGWAFFLDTYFSAFTPSGSLSVHVSVPSFTVPGDYAVVQVTYSGTPVDPDSISVSLVYPNGTSTPLEPARLDTGVYAVRLPNATFNGTVFLVAKAYYWEVSASGSAATRLGGLEALMPLVDARLAEILEAIRELNASIAYVGNGVFELKVGQETVLARLEEVRDGIATLDAGVARLKLSVEDLARALASNATALQDLIESLGANVTGLLRALNASIIALHDTVALVNTSLGTVTVGLDKLGARVQLISDDLAVLKTALGSVNGTLIEIKDGLAYINTSIGRAVAEASAAKAHAAEASLAIHDAAGSIQKRVTIAIALSAAATGVSAATLAYIVVQSRRRPQRRVELF